MTDTVSNAALHALLVAEGFPADQITLADETYGVPTESAIRSFGKRYASYLRNLDLLRWSEENWDCDEFAFTAKSLSMIDNAKFARKMDNEYAALGFGLAFAVTSEGGHAINAAVRLVDGRHEIHYFEPQMENYLCLNRIPRESLLSLSWCYF